MNASGAERRSATAFGIALLLALCALTLPTINRVQINRNTGELTRIASEISSKAAPPSDQRASLTVRWSEPDSTWGLDSSPRAAETDEAWIDRHMEIFKRTRAQYAQR